MLLRSCPGAVPRARRIRSMKPTLAPGLTLTRKIQVDEARCITFMGPEAMVYATPSMVNDVEYACYDALLPQLDAGESSVGSRVEIDHLGPTPHGMTVEIRVTLVQVDKRRMTFEFSVRDEDEEVGRGTHTRFVVDSARTRERIAAKRARAGRATG